MLLFFGESPPRLVIRWFVFGREVPYILDMSNLDIFFKSEFGIK